MLVRRLLLIGGFTALACSPTPTFGPELPLIGAWKLDPARTFYGPSVEKRVDENFICSTNDAVMHCRISSTMEDGKVNSGSFDAVPDGPPGEVSGIEGLDSVRLRGAEPGIMEATFYDRDEPRFAYRAWREADGHSLVIVTVDPITRDRLSTTVVYRASRPLP